MKLLTEEYEEKRDIFSFLRWMHLKSIEIKSEPDSNKLYFERTGNIKKFFEEAVPIGFLALFKYSLGRQIDVQCFTGNQPYDGIIAISDELEKKENKIEVTTIETEESSMRRQAMSRNGWAFFTGPVRRDNKNKRKIITQCKAADVIESENEFVDLAFSRFKAKAEKRYDSNTEILVFLNCPAIPRHEVRYNLRSKTDAYLRKNRKVTNMVYYLYCLNGYIECVPPPNEGYGYILPKEGNVESKDL